MVRFPFILTVCVLLLSSCNSSSTQIQTPSTVSSGCKDEREFSLRSFPTYEDEIKDLLDEHCLGCHEEGASDPAMDGWENARQAARAAVSAIENERMPPSTDLDEKVVRMFTLWEKADFPETVDDIDESGSNEEEDEDRDNDSDSSSDDCL